MSKIKTDITEVADLNETQDATITIHSVVSMIKEQQAVLNEEFTVLQQRLSEYQQVIGNIQSRLLTIRGEYEGASKLLASLLPTEDSEEFKIASKMAAAAGTNIVQFGNDGFSPVKINKNEVVEGDE